jgi:hypothetical protein
MAHVHIQWWALILVALDLKISYMYCSFILHLIFLQYVGIQ